MMNQNAPDTRQDAPPTHRFVPVAEATRILGLSATTIRRRIDAGELEAERVVRPQGTAFLVRVPPDAPPGASEASGTPQDEPGTHHHVPAGSDHLVAVVVPLVAQIDALRMTVERQSAQLIEQAETIGRLTAELAAVRAQNGTLDASGATEDQKPSHKPPSAATGAPGTPWWRRWLVAVSG
jgi:hypothetical protein